jgi:bifunctional DNA-binding transcriptional regulator/antitoxin component of YhaV-PrlF toxin-antitoxin module
MKDLDKTHMKTKIENHNGEYFVIIPDELLAELGWSEGDDVRFETTMDLYDNGDVTSIVIANMTKHPDIVK